MAIKIGYFAGEAVMNLRRNKLMTIAAVLTCAVSLLLLGGVLTVGKFVGGFTRSVEDQVEVSVFLRDDITVDQESDIKQTLQDLPVVSGVSYVSKQDAFKEFKELYEDQPALWENIDEEVLPASYRVRLSDPKRVDLIRSKLDGNPAVEEISDQRETVQKLVSVTNLLRLFSFVMVVVLFGAAVLLIANTIQLAIYARRKQIEIMKLVGATNWFVRLPFMLEGIVAGIVGAVIALLLLGAGKFFARSALPVFVPRAALQGVDPTQVVTLVVLGLSIGALGSAVALRRFLDA